MAEESKRSFFWTLAQRAGSQQRENQLSSTFAACFAQSPWFRGVVLDTVRRACRIGGPVKRTDWVCREQVCPPRGGRERIDIRLSPSPPRQGIPTFHLESKVEAPLTEQQLKNYRRRGAEYLVAVTKHPPDVSERQLRQIGAFALRWQDLHRALLTSRPIGQIDRFIRSTFTVFLEELGMAHAADLTLHDVKIVQRTLQNLRSDRRKYFVPKDAFQLTDAILDFLGDVKRQFIESNPKFDRFRGWGPGFGLYFEDGEFLSYVFAWSLGKPPSKKRRYGFYMALPLDSSEPVIGIEDTQGKQSDYSKEWPLKTFTTKGVLSREKCVRRLFSVAKKRRIISAARSGRQG